MGIAYYIGSADGTSWTLKKSWTEGTFPAATADKEGRVYIFRVHNNNIEMAYSDNPDDENSWSDFQVVISGVDTGDIGAVCNKDIGDYGRIIVSYWKSGSRKVSYSDDRGTNWTEVNV